MVNFGIDLGTTNSLIAKFDNGHVEIFKNPNGFKETLPSVVGFRKDRILVGDQARNYVEKDPKNVASRFKRKMGATETIRIQSAGSKTPVELSAFVLKELKNFVHSGEAVEAAAFDSGLKALSARITEDLPLREGAFNLFQFRILDAQNNPIDVGFDSIQIAQGRYSVAGQMLPEDICLVTDDIANKDTRLKKIFQKNRVLPATEKGIPVEVAKTIVKGSTGEIRIMVVEGPSEKHSSTNKQIGILLITGKQINRDLIKGTEIDLTFQMSESRDLTVSAYRSDTSLTGPGTTLGR
jgi:molecular chaperone DnaK (HSP70)